MTRKTIKRLGASIVALAAIVSPLAAPIATRAEATPSASAAAVVQWNANAIAAIVAAGQGPPVALLNLAMVQGAVYDAVNGIDGGHEPYLEAPAAADGDDSMEAAAVTAAHHVLVALYASSPSIVANLDAQYATSLGLIPDGNAKADGIVVGAQAAATMIAARTGDGRGGAFTIVEGFEPGEWRRTNPTDTPPYGFEPAPWVGNVTPFLLDSAAALRSEGPNRLKSDAYTRDFRETKRYGSLSSAVRTADQTDAALFWQGHGAALWNAIFRQLAETQGLDITEAARLFAMTDMAGADGAIACWNDKYHWRFWRPVTAIHEAASDGNPGTHADKAWQPLFTTPPFPEHPSGHSCVSGAIVRTLKDFFGTDEISFSATSSFSSSTRSFDSFSEAINEIIDARVWAGIHFRTADRQGRGIGIKVAHVLAKNYFLPVG